MKTLRTEKIEPVYVISTLPKREDMEQGKIYISEEYKATTHLCLCGCGTECYLPLSDNDWILREENEKVTITPSILQRFTCKSHYIITNGIANFV